MTNNPSKVAGIEGHGLEIVEHVPLISEATEFNKKYLKAKRDKLGHWFPAEQDS
jgi:3,4-dihydroxy 2-butanone 4-phosphate synthase/GTP cyclohydrolase II